jgi:general secretion pathway protein B
MSLILEALRKSEAERRRGEAPGLRVELPPPAARASRTLPGWTLVAAALSLALLAGVVAWWPRGGSDRVDATDIRPMPAGGDIAAPSESPSPPSAAERPDATGPADTDYPRVDRITPSVPSPAPADTAPLPAPVPAPKETGTAAEPTLPASAPLPAAEAPPPAIHEPGAAAVSPTVPRATAGMPRLTELAPDQRQRLPAMKLSMHMWNDDPARRFVVIDGQRKSEGDRIGDATIAAIDRDGVVLDLDGRPVRVPLP